MLLLELRVPKNKPILMEMVILRLESKLEYSVSNFFSKLLDIEAI